MRDRPRTSSAQSSSSSSVGGGGGDGGGGGSRRRRWEVKTKESFEKSVAVEINSPVPTTTTTTPATATTTTKARHRRRGDTDQQRGGGGGGTANPSYRDTREKTQPTPTRGNGEETDDLYREEEENRRSKQRHKQRNKDETNTFNYETENKTQKQRQKQEDEEEDDLYREEEENRRSKQRHKQRNKDETNHFNYETENKTPNRKRIQTNADATNPFDEEDDETTKSEQGSEHETPLRHTKHRRANTNDTNNPFYEDTKTETPEKHKHSDEITNRHRNETVRKHTKRRLTNTADDDTNNPFYEDTNDSEESSYEKHEHEHEKCDILSVKLSALIEEAKGRNNTDVYGRVMFRKDNTDNTNAHTSDRKGSGKKIDNTNTNKKTKNKNTNIYTKGGESRSECVTNALEGKLNSVETSENTNQTNETNEDTNDGIDTRTDGGERSDITNLHDTKSTTNTKHDYETHTYTPTTTTPTAPPITPTTRKNNRKINKESYVTLQLREMEDDIVHTDAHEPYILSAQTLLINTKITAAASTPDTNARTVYREGIGGSFVEDKEPYGVVRKSECLRNSLEVPSASGYAVSLQSGFRTFAVLCQGLLAGVTLAHCLVIFLSSVEAAGVHIVHPRVVTIVFCSLIVGLTSLCLVAAFDRCDLTGVGVISGRGIRLPWTPALYVSSLVLSLVAVRAESVLVSYDAYMDQVFTEEEVVGLVVWWRWICVTRTSLCVLGWLTVVADPHTDALLDRLYRK